MVLGGLPKFYRDFGDLNIILYSTLAGKKKFNFKDR